MSNLNYLIFKKPTEEYLAFRNYYDTVIQPICNKFILRKNRTTKETDAFVEEMKGMSLDAKKRFPYPDK
ncbi:hypothetical protein BTO07_09520 [Polaribacter sp. SA4-12]|nr:hypothetical protein BTO07_09520 [Polaribacter sp. SA4-12]